MGKGGPCQKGCGPIDSLGGSREGSGQIWKMGISCLKCFNSELYESQDNETIPTSAIHSFHIKTVASC